MAYAYPRYLEATRADTASMHFLWDDTRASEDFRFDAAPVVARAAGITLRARIALGIGVYEWIAFRFRRVSSDRLPEHVAEASWCACADRDCFEYFELDRDDWLGPVRGPLWCATTWLLPMLFFSDERPEEWESGLEYLPRLAVHVMPDATVFTSWMNQCLDRLERVYPAQPDDPFDDLFNEHEEARRGPLVAREVLDPAFPFRLPDATDLINRFMATADFTGNPLLLPRHRRR
ncbi:hypothetical protein [Piscinibacter sp. XHJ-5]|uniref:hypothetical protein n=1 Tax=Piscinibacter sp. XHJ-5 TaxID=3037797 RepID=UPI0024530FF9|nr:hypothetical protein [Piscinibacter sp. XHJ-5]